jgi:hypothetical protein
MDFELKFTSAEAGVKRSAQGFCTVFATAGTPPPLVDRLESLSVYRHLFPAGQPGEERNPVAFSHVIVPVFGEPHHVLSRVQSAGLDYSKRFNYFAHHRVVDAGELPACGPAWLVGRPEVLQSAWDGVVATPPSCRPLVSRSVQPAVARYWQTVTGDAGWAGWVLERWQANPDGEVVFIVAPGDPVLELVQECVALLPTAARWRFTFSTYTTKLPPDVECHLRFAVAGTPEAQARNAVDLRSLRGQSPPASPFVDAARQGKEAPITLAPPRASSGAPRPAAAHKFSNLGDLPPLPSEATRPTFKTDASATTPSGSSNKNILLIAVAAIFLMLCGAGYMFWDAQQREAERIAAAEREEQEKEAKAAEDAEKKKLEERRAELRRQADVEAENDSKAKQADKDKREREQIESEKQKVEMLKAKEAADKMAAEAAAKASNSRSLVATKSEELQIEYIEQAFPSPPANPEAIGKKVMFKSLSFTPTNLTLHQSKPQKAFQATPQPSGGLLIEHGGGGLDLTPVAVLMPEINAIAVEWKQAGSARKQLFNELPTTVIEASGNPGSTGRAFVSLRPRCEPITEASSGAFLKREILISSTAKRFFNGKPPSLPTKVKQSWEAAKSLNRPLKLRLERFDANPDQPAWRVAKQAELNSEAEITFQDKSVTFDRKPVSAKWKFTQKGDSPCEAELRPSLEQMENRLSEAESEKARLEREKTEMPDRIARKEEQWKEAQEKDQRRLRRTELDNLKGQDQKLPKLISDASEKLASLRQEEKGLLKALSAPVVASIYFEVPVGDRSVSVEVMRFEAGNALKVKGSN